MIEEEINDIKDEIDKVHKKLDFLLSQYPLRPFTEFKSYLDAQNYIKSKNWTGDYLFIKSVPVGMYKEE